MIRSIVLAGLLTGGYSPVPTSDRPAVPPPCCAPDSGMVAELTTASITRLISSPGWQDIRDSLGIHAVDAGEVQLISDETLCRRMSAALDSSCFNPPRKSQAFMMRAGEYYLAHPIGVHAGEFGTLVVYDSTFVFKGATTVQRGRNTP